MLLSWRSRRFPRFRARSRACPDVLITQFRATSELTPAVKELGPETRVEPVAVSGDTGCWIEGDLHLLRYRAPGGVTIEDRTRLVGDVLVWQGGELTLRIEGARRRTRRLRSPNRWNEWWIWEEPGHSFDGVAARRHFGPTSVL